MSFYSSGNINNDEAIIRSLQQNSLLKRKAEEQLFNSYLYFIREGMSKHSLQEEDAFDAYSDTILQSIENIKSGQFENRSSLKTYLFRIFSNKCVDLVRKKTTNKGSVHQTAPIVEMLNMIADSAKTVIQQLIEKTDMDLLKNTINDLGENCRKILSLFGEGYNDKKIATAMDYKTSDVVKTSRLRCIEKLRQLYLNKKD